MESESNKRKRNLEELKDNKMTFLKKRGLSILNYLIVVKEEFNEISKIFSYDLRLMFIKFIEYFNENYKDNEKLGFIIIKKKSDYL